MKRKSIWTTAGTRTTIRMITAMHMGTAMNTGTAMTTTKHMGTAMRAIINRLKRSIGHLDKVRRMVEDGEDCADVLIQLSAVKSEINNTGKLILKQHMEHCIVEAVRENDQTSIDKMNEAIDRFMK